MKKEQLEVLKEALNGLIYQIDNHQQARKPIADVERIISELQVLNHWNKQENVYNALHLIQGAIADPQGLGRLNLLLDNARIPKQYYDIFYKMLYVDKYGGGSGASSIKSLAFLQIFEFSLKVSKQRLKRSTSIPLKRPIFT